MLPLQVDKYKHKHGRRYAWIFWLTLVFAYILYCFFLAFKAYQQRKNPPTSFSYSNEQWNLPNIGLAFPAQLSNARASCWVEYGNDCAFCQRNGVHDGVAANGDCVSHEACTDIEYCTMYGFCWPCDDCIYSDDSVDGKCPDCFITEEFEWDDYWEEFDLVDDDGEEIGDYLPPGKFDFDTEECNFRFPFNGTDGGGLDYLLIDTNFDSEKNVDSQTHVQVELLFGFDSGTFTSYFQYGYKEFGISFILLEEGEVFEREEPAKLRFDIYGEILQSEIVVKRRVIQKLDSAPEVEFDSVVSQMRVETDALGSDPTMTEDLYQLTLRLKYDSVKGDSFETTIIEEIDPLNWASLLGIMGGALSYIALVFGACFVLPTPERSPREIPCISNREGKDSISLDSMYIRL